MAISRMDMERQMRNMGGIMGLEDQRQGYFLGKLVKKITKPIKKIVKSPLGKAALLAGGAYLAGGFMPGGGGLRGGFSNFSNFGRGIGSLFRAAGTRGVDDKGGFLRSLIRDKEGNFSLGRAALSGLGAASIAAPFFMGGEEEEDTGTPFGMAQPDIEDIRSQAKAYYSDPTNSALYFMPPRAAVPSSFYADGGLASLRPGYAGGQLVGPSGDGSRPGYAGESDIGILDVIKSFPSAVGQIFSGKTESMLGDNQEEKNKFMIQDMFPDIDKETLSMIVDMKNRGAGVDEISTITGQDASTITNMLSILNMKAYGGRIGFSKGGSAYKEYQQDLEDGIISPDTTFNEWLDNNAPEPDYDQSYASGGRIGKAEGGLMDLGGMEKDYREGGFVPLGAEERADDVPARLSKNEFVFTADAVRNAGQGDIDKGAEVMQNMMDNLESGGTISEESQGMENPAQEMFDQSQLLESRIA